MLRTNIFYIFLFIFLIIAGFFSIRMLSYYNEGPDKTEDNELSQKEETRKLESSRSYSDENVSFKIPQGFVLKKESEGIYIERDVLKIGSVGTNFINISKTEDFKDTRTENLYTLMNDLEVNESKILDEELPEYFTYSRLTDREISGMQSKAFINQNPNNSNPGTKEKLYLVKSSAGIEIVIRAYLGSDTRDSYYISEENFENFVNEMIIN